MKTIVDNQIAKILALDPAKIVESPNLNKQISFGWPALLEYLGLGSIFSKLSAFQQGEALFEATVLTLCEHEEKQVLFHVYDSLFTEILNQIKDLPEIKAPFLLQKIAEQRQKSSFMQIEKIVSQTLTAYEVALTKEPAPIMRNLILYLAWDRMCVWMARLFDYQSTDLKFIIGLDVLKECLMESYQHIAQQGQTSPGIYRMLEAFFFYHMREENIEKHTDAEWTLLSHGSQVIQAQNQLVDCAYIDEAVIASEKLVTEEENSECYLTMDTSEDVDSRFGLAEYMLDKLKLEFPQWNSLLKRANIVYINV